MQRDHIGVRKQHRKGHECRGGAGSVSRSRHVDDACADALQHRREALPHRAKPDEPDCASSKLAEVVENVGLERPSLPGVRLPVENPTAVGASLASAAA